MHGGTCPDETAPSPLEALACPISLSSPPPSPPLPISSIIRACSEEQRKPVKGTTGVTMVTAGPGSGKTRVLTTRVAYMISQLGISPQASGGC